MQIGEFDGTSHSESNQMVAFMMDIGVGERVQQLQMSDRLNKYDKEQVRKHGHP